MAGESFQPSFFSRSFPEYRGKVTAGLAFPLLIAFAALLLTAAAAFFPGARFVLLGGGGILFLLALACTFFCRSLLVAEKQRENEEILLLFDSVHNGKADLSRPSVTPKHKDVEPIYNHYGEFLDAIRQLIGEIRKIGIGIAVNSTKVASTVQSTAAKSQEQKELSSIVSTSSNEASQAIAEVSQNTQYVSERTTNNLGMARQSFSELADVTEKIGLIHETVQSFSKTVEKLGRNSRDILEIVSIINTISEQTNLLSLNATIEAARASEHGKGFAVVAEEVRDLARRITPATEKITENIKMMTAIVEKTQQETEQIMEYSAQTDEVVKRTTDNFSTLINDFETADEQLMRIAAAIEELSTNNAAATAKAEDINTLTQAVAADMEISASAVQDLNSITEQMLEMVASFRTGEGRFDEIIGRAAAIRSLYEETIAALNSSGVDVFDSRYKKIPDTNPQKFETSFSAAFLERFGPLLDEQLRTIEGAIYCLAVDRNGYIPVHHAAVSQPMTGNPERDLLYSRHQRIYMSNETERKRCSHTKPLLLQTYMRDTGEILNDLSMPIFVNKRHWGALIIGLKPETLLDQK